MNLKNLLRSFLGIPLTVIAFIFIGKIFYDGRDQIFDSLKTIKPELFLLGLLFYASFFAVKSFVWIKILSARGHNPESRQTIYHYSLSEIKRYIPGSIFAFIGRVDTHKNIPKKETLKGIGIEAILLVSSALIVSIPALFFLTKNFLPQFYPSLKILILSLIIFSILFSLVSNKTGLIVKKYIDIFFVFAIAWSLYAIGSLFIFLSLTFTDPQDFITIASIFTLSWMGGYLLFITPMGLGARELITTFALSFFISPALAGAIAVITRLAMVCGELFYLSLSYSFSRVRNNSSILKINPYFAIVIAVAFLYFMFFSYYSNAKHDTFLTGRFDLGNMDQTVWNTRHGRFFELTNPDGVNNISRLGVHSDIFLVFLSPLYLLWESPKVLLIFQSLSLAIAGIFVYLISKKITGKEIISVIFAMSFFSNFWVHEQNLFDFHAVSVATMFLLAAFYFLLKKRALIFLLFLLLAATTKENIFLILSVFGVFFLKKKAWGVGLILTIIPVLIFFLLISYAIPSARGEEHFALEAYQYLGNSPIDMLKNAILNPSIISHQIFNYSTFEYLNNHLFPVGYLTLLSPFYVLFALPDMAIYLFSSNFGYRSYQYHFGAAILPFIYIGAMFGFKKLICRFKNYKLEKVASYYLAFITLYTLYSYSPIPGMKKGDASPLYIKNSMVIEKYLTFIPATTDVAASNSLGAHLSQREKIYVAPLGIEQATYVALYREKREMLDKIDLTKYDFVIQDEENNFFILRKKFNLTCTTCMP